MDRYVPSLGHLLVVVQKNIFKKMLSVTGLPTTPFRETVFLAFGLDTAAECSLQARIETRRTNSVRMDVHCRCMNPTWSC